MNTEDTILSLVANERNLSNYIPKNKLDLSYSIFSCDILCKFIFTSGNECQYSFIIPENTCFYFSNIIYATLLASIHDILKAYQFHIDITDKLYYANYISLEDTETYNDLFENIIDIFGVGIGSTIAYNVIYYGGKYTYIKICDVVKSIKEYFWKGHVNENTICTHLYKNLKGNGVLSSNKETPKLYRDLYLKKYPILNKYLQIVEKITENITEKDLKDVEEIWKKSLEIEGIADELFLVLLHIYYKNNKNNEILGKIIVMLNNLLYYLYENDVDKYKLAIKGCMCTIIMLNYNDKIVDFFMSCCEKPENTNAKVTSIRLNYIQEEVWKNVQNDIMCEKRFPFNKSEHYMKLDKFRQKCNEYENESKINKCIDWYIDGNINEMDIKYGKNWIDEFDKNDEIYKQVMSSRLPVGRRRQLIQIIDEQCKLNELEDHHLCILWNKHKDLNIMEKEYGTDWIKRLELKDEIYQQVRKIQHDLLEQEKKQQENKRKRKKSESTEEEEETPLEKRQKRYDLDRSNFKEKYESAIRELLLNKESASKTLNVLSQLHAKYCKKTKEFLDLNIKDDDTLNILTELINYFNKEKISLNHRCENLENLFNELKITGAIEKNIKEAVRKIRADKLLKIKKSG